MIAEYTYAQSASTTQLTAPLVIYPPQGTNNVVPVVSRVKNALMVAQHRLMGR